MKKHCDASFWPRKKVKKWKSNRWVSMMDRSGMVVPTHRWIPAGVSLESAGRRSRPFYKRKRYILAVVLIECSSRSVLLLSSLNLHGEGKKINSTR